MTTERRKACPYESAERFSTARTRLHSGRAARTVVRAGVPMCTDRNELCGEAAALIFDAETDDIAREMVHHLRDSAATIRARPPCVLALLAPLAEIAAPPTPPPPRLVAHAGGGARTPPVRRSAPGTPPAKR